MLIHELKSVPDSDQKISPKFIQFHANPQQTTYFEDNQNSVDNIMGILCCIPYRLVEEYVLSMLDYVSHILVYMRLL